MNKIPPLPFLLRAQLQGRFDVEQFSRELVQPKRTSLHQPRRGGARPRVIRERFLPRLPGEFDQHNNRRDEDAARQYVAQVHFTGHLSTHHEFG